ncbi:hypothetical protein BGZ74_008819 [Mortierella antarctica]|nr:hypothetical protein BGZ74_008819 [Mortierella antarctica]
MASTTPAHFAKDPSGELAAAMESPVSFKLYYFPVMGRGATSRDILALAGVDFKNVYPENWDEEVVRTPFGGLPVLFITGKNGEEAVISEAAVIETYLAKMCGLLGDDIYEETVIKAFHSTIFSMHDHFSTAVTFIQPEVRVKSITAFKPSTLPTFCASLEKHLVANGGNGHFVGSKLSLADIRAANLIEHFAQQPWGPGLLDVVGQYPNLKQLRESVATHPGLTHWRRSKEWAELWKGTKEYFADTAAAKL